MKITLLCVGNLKEDYLKKAANEYLKRLKGYAEISVVEVKEEASIDPEANKRKEGERLLKNIKPGEYVILLDLAKTEYDSIALSKKLDEWFVKGGAKITFVIGGSDGLSDDVRKRANDSLTLSRLTFTHQLTRIILLEQVYRGFRILSGEPYHK